MGAGELVAPFVEGIAGMAVHVLEGHGPAHVLDRFDLQQAGSDQVSVLVDLVAGESADGVERISVDRDLGRGLDRFETGDDGAQFHAVVGCGRLTARDLPGVFPALQDGGESAWAGIVGA